MNAEKDIHDYLLGALPAERLEEIEQRILSDDDFHQEVEIAEEELLDDYVQGRLAAQERPLFENHFLASPLRQQRLKFALALQKKLNSRSALSPSPIRSPINLYRYALAASLLLAAILGSMNYLSSKAIQKERNNVAELKAQLEQARQQASTVAPNSVLSTRELLPMNRGLEQLQIQLPENLLVVRIPLILSSGIQGNIRIELLNDAEQSIFSLETHQIEHAQGKNIVTATIERKFLNPGNYFLRVTSLQPPVQEKYAFQVVPHS